MKNIKNKLITCGSIVGLSVILIASISYVSFSHDNGSSNKKYIIDGEVFDNFEALSKHMESKYLANSYNVLNRNKWSLSNGNKTLYFNDPKLLREYLLNQIQTYNTYSSFDLNNTKYIGENGELVSQAFSKLHFNNGSPIKRSSIYKGRNNSIHKSIESAKDSYLSIHDAYYFNNLFFNNKEQLQLYLNNEYYGDDLQNPGYQKALKGIGIVSSNGSISNSIKKDYLYANPNNDKTNKDKIIDAKKTFSSFVNSNLNKYIDIVDINGDHTIYDQNDINNSYNLINVFDSPDYTKLYSNAGQGTYVVDLNQDDKNSLFGPYYISSTKDIELMYDLKHWKKIDKNDPIVLQEKDANILSSFLSTLLMPDEDKEFASLPINIKSVNKKLQMYFNELKRYNNTIYLEFCNMFNILQSGKRFNLFNGLIISYKWLINNLIKHKSPERIIKLTKTTFNEIAKTIDKYINLIFDESILISKTGDKLSFENILGFNNNNRDLNSTLKSYIDEISSNWPQFIVCLNLINFAQTNSFANGGAIKFNYSKLKEMIDSTKSYKENIFDEKYKGIYEYLFNLFSSDNPNEFNSIIERKLSRSSYESNKQAILEMCLSFTYSAKLGSNIIKSIYENTIYSSFDQVLSSPIYKQLNYIIGSKINSINQEAENHEIYPDRPEYITNEKISFENFALINMIEKNSKNQQKNEIVNGRIYGLLESFRKNEFNNMTLNQKLIEIINQFKNDFFFNQFVIFNDIQSWIKEISKNAFVYFKYISEIILSSTCLKQDKKIYDLLNSFTNGAKEMFSIIDEVKDMNKLNETLKKVFSKIKIASSAFAFINAALEVVDILINAFVPKTEYFSYVFENDNAKYIWNGGMKKTMFWGLTTLEQHDIHDMKLNQPIKIVDPINEDQYYFNGKKYNDLDILKREQLKLILNDQYNLNDSVSKLYSFDDLKGSSSSSKSFKTIGTYEDILTLDQSNINNLVPNNLVQYIYKEIYLELNKPKDQRKYHIDNFIFENSGLTINGVEGYEEVVNEILKNIKASKIVQLPLLKNGRPDDFSSIDEFNEMNTYELPSYSWTNDGIILNNSNKKYIIFDPNTEEQKDMSNDAIEKLIKNQFYNQFDVESKIVIDYDIDVNNSFEDMETNIISYNVYEATLPNGYSTYFISHAKAISWLLSNMNFTVYEYSETINNYQYNGQFFNSKDEFESYLIENMEVKNG